MSKQRIYLDYAAATPLDERVLRAMLPYFQDDFYNPSAAYLAARSVKKDVAAARSTIAHLIGARDSEVIFTAGATESVNLAISGVLAANAGKTFVTITAEHASVLALADKHGATQVRIDAHGHLSVQELIAAITDEVVLISIALINNELGTIQPIKDIASEVAALRRERLSRGNRLPLYLHIDASQAAGHIDLHVARLGVDMMTLNAAKVYGPKQVGLLYVGTHVAITPVIVGGGQERGLRSGTENVAGIIGFAEALRIAEELRHDETAQLENLRHIAIQKLISIPGTQINSPAKRSSPHILNVSFEGIDGERLLMQLDERGVMVATGSACAANHNTRSHVLEAIGLSDELIAGSLRLSFGRETTEAEIETACEQIAELVGLQRGRS